MNPAQIQPMKLPFRIAYTTALVIAAVITSNKVSAALVQPFVQGNLVVDRAGDGSAPLTSAGTGIFLDQYTPGGTFVSTVSVPTNGPTPFVDVGNSFTEGFLSLNPLGTNLVLAGYNVPLGTAAPASASAGVDPRAIGVVDYNGNFTLCATSTVAHSTGNIRAAATDGNGNFWSVGSFPIGTFYMGTNSPTNYISSTVANERTIQVIGGNIYYSTGSGSTRGVYKITGLPTTPGNTAVSTINVGNAALPYAFSFNPTLNQAYVAESDNYTNSAGLAGIEKWTNNGVSWVFLYSMAPGMSNGADGLCVNWTTTPPTIYATTADGTALVSLQDNGPGTVATTNALAPLNTQFHSVMLTPTNPAPVALPPTLAATSITPANLTIGTGASATFTLNGFSGYPVASNNWYEIIGTTTNLFSNQIGALTVNNLAVGNYSFFAILTNASGSVTSSVVSLTVTPAPVINFVTPANATNFTGGQVTFTVNASVGNPTSSNLWFRVTAGVTNLLTDGLTGSGSTISGSSTTNLTIFNISAADTTNYFVVLTNSFGSATSSVVHLFINDKPSISAISPTGTNSYNAGNIAAFTLTTGPAPASNLWFQVTTNGTTNLIAVEVKAPGVTNILFGVTNLTSANSGKYFATLTNSSGSAASAVVTVTVVDPFIVQNPSSASGLAFGTIQFAAIVGGLQPINYQWYYSDTSGHFIAPAASLGDGSTISGANSNVLTLSNWHPGDLTNFVLVAQNANGSVTSSVASVLISIPNGTVPPSPELLPLTNGVLALWDFDGPQYTNFLANPNCVYNPAPLIGAGTAGPVGSVFNPTTVENLANLTSTSTSPFATGANDPNDVGFDAGEGGFVFTPYGFQQPSPNGSWGTDNYPATNGVNKANGVQFNVSTVGAQNVKIAYDSRLSGTASLYERLQYTTNGTAWIDYPESSTFGAGNFGTGDAGFYTFSYDLSAIPGVNNNPNFGFRIVTEWQNTATYYAVGSTNWWVGVANSYSTPGSDVGNAAPGTVTYDLVAVIADAITNNNTQPVFAPFNLAPNTDGLPSTNMIDTNTIVINFSVSSTQMPGTNITVTGTALGMITGNSQGPGSDQVTVPATINPNLAITNTGGNNFSLTISFPPGQGIPDTIDSAPILLTATDTNGEVASASFLLTVDSINQDPTNTLTSIGSEHMLANTSLMIPFTVGGTHDGTSNLTINVASDNNTVIPVGNVVVGGNLNTGNMTLTVTPAANQVGNAQISVTVNDNLPAEPRSTKANILFTVQPNTNVVAVDYFNYDGGSGSSLDIVGAPYWSHLSGILHQLQLGPNDTAVISDADTENVQAPLIGGPYAINSGTVLYASMTVNMSSSGMPTGNGNYFFSFNDGSGSTAHVEGNVIATTNGAAPGMYRLGVGNGGPNGANGANGQIFQQDLSPNTSYFIIMSLSLNDGFTTLWLSPSNAASASVTDTTALDPTNQYNIYNIDLREVGGNEGIVSVGNLIVGTSFSSVFYPPQAVAVSFEVAENTTSLLNPLPYDGGFALSVATVSETDGNGTPASNGTNITFVPTTDFVGTAIVNYTVVDNLGNTSAPAPVTITVAAVAASPTNSASITGEFRSGANLVIKGTNNNVPNTAYHYEVLTTTNIATPLSNWTPVATNPFNADGTFEYTNPIVPGTPRQFIDVKAVP